MSSKGSRTTDPLGPPGTPGHRTPDHPAAGKPSPIPPDVRLNDEDTILEAPRIEVSLVDDEPTSLDSPSLEAAIPKLPLSATPTPPPAGSIAEALQVRATKSESKASAVDLNGEASKVVDAKKSKASSKGAASAVKGDVDAMAADAARDSKPPVSEAPSSIGSSLPPEPTPTEVDSTETAPVEPTEPSTAAETADSEKKAAKKAGDIKLRLFGRTDVGQVREHNEDNFLVADLTKASRGLMEVDRTQLVGERGTVLGVCDGMGGAAAGEVASQLAVDIVYERMLQGSLPSSRDDLASRLVSAIETAGLRIFAEAKADRTRRGMGTTATIAALVDGVLFLGQVGDSRGYLLRGDKLVQVTRDQSLVNQLIEAGQLTEEEAETFEHNNIILQALGTAESVQVDLTYVELRKGDALLLCSDGLSGMVRNDEIREVLRTIDDPLEACRELTDRANQAGGHDNVTVVIARFEGEGLEPPTPDEVADLKYRKYELPEGSHPSSRPDPKSSGYPPRSMTIKSLRPPPSGHGDADDGYEDDLEDAVRRAEDGVDLPREPTPSWVATMLIVSAVTCVVVAGYYFLR